MLISPAELEGRRATPPAAHTIAAGLDRVAHADRITVALRDAHELVGAAMRSTDPAADALLLAAAIQDGDAITAIAATHAIAAIAEPSADRVLVHLVNGSTPTLVSHAAWALGARSPLPAAVPALLSLLASGGFDGMLAERTLLEWSRVAPQLVPAPILGRSRQRRVDRSHLARPRRGDGVVVIQPFLHARLDETGSALGAGDAGGIASLLRSLGTSLAQHDEIDEVITITRAEPLGDGATASLSGTIGDGHRIERIAYGSEAMVPWRAAWRYRALIEHEMLNIGRALGSRRVVWHLRMADVGTLAAAAAARRLGHAVVFTVAPDPHGVIDALEADGRLDRASFAAEDATWQYWFRARMVERLCAHVDHLALLPRPGLRRDLIDLVGLTAMDLDARSDVVPEGIDITAIDAARTRRSHQTAAPGPVARVLSQIPPDRRHLPWVLSIGRLHPLKGPHRIVGAVAASEDLARRFNVVLIGGDLEHPSPDERATLDLIRTASDGLAPGTVSVIGHCPPADVADLLVHAAESEGVYVCASDKEEFGLAIVEALAAGLIVVAPERGGPQTYVDHGANGVLCDTTSIPQLSHAIGAAASMAGDPRQMAASRALTRAEFSIDTMAARLASLYSTAIDASSVAA